MAAKRKPMCKKYGRLTVVSEAAIRRFNQASYWCQCECGNWVIALASSLRWGKTTSCGCGRAGKNNVNYKHGLYGSKTWGSHRAMLDRCYNPAAVSYGSHGALGVTVCRRWRARKGKGFLNFVADVGVRPPGMTLDRINPFGNYEPKNCKWADKFEQANNKRASEKNRIYLVSSFDDPDAVVF